MKKLSLLIGFVFVFFSAFFVSPALAAESFSSPNVLDNAKMFTASDVKQIDTALAVTWEKDNLLTVVETIDTLNGENLEIYATDRANQLGIGLPNESNGVYFLIVEEDRLVRLELGKGTNQVVSDIDAEKIIDMVITPTFSTGNYASGVIKGVEELGKVYTANLNNDDTESTTLTADNGGGVIAVGIIFIVGLIIGIGVWVIHRERDKPNKHFFENMELVNKTFKLFSAEAAYKTLTPEERIQKIKALLQENAPSVKFYIKGLESEVLEKYMDNLSRLYLQKAGMKPETAWVYAKQGKFTAANWLANKSVADAEKDIMAAAKKISDSYHAAEAKKRKEKEELNKQAKTLYKKMSRAQRKEVERAPSTKRKKELVAQYTGASSDDISLLIPYMTALYFVSSSSSGSSSGYSSSSSSSSSYSSSSYDSSSYSSFGGGSFDGGGASGSW